MANCSEPRGKRHKSTRSWKPIWAMAGWTVLFSDEREEAAYPKRTNPRRPKTGDAGKNGGGSVLKLAAWWGVQSHGQVQGLSFKESLVPSYLQPFIWKVKACSRESLGCFVHGNLNVYFYGKATCWKWWRGWDVVSGNLMWLSLVRVYKNLFPWSYVFHCNSWYFFLHFHWPILTSLLMCQIERNTWHIKAPISS